MLDALLTAWEGEWTRMMERPYTPEDLVVPCPKPTSRRPRKPPGAMRDRHYVWKRAQPARSAYWDGGARRKASCEAPLLRVGGVWAAMPVATDAAGTGLLIAFHPVQLP